MKKTESWNIVLVSFAQFGTAFAFNFMYVFLPFYISAISPYAARETLLWTGLIMGSTGLCMAFTAPAWGSLTHRYNPKRLFVIGMFCQAVLLALMGLLTDVHALFILRILQGGSGGVSTIGLIIISVSSSPEKRTFHFGVFQSSLTLGQLIGPSAGAFAVALLGYRWSFVSAALILFAASLFCHLCVADLPPLPREMKSSAWSVLNKRILTGWVLCLAATIHLMFLPSIFPLVSQRFGLDKDVALKWAGLIVMFYTSTSMIGTYLWGYIAGRMGVRKIINVLLISGILLPALLVFTKSLVPFTMVIMLETGMVAAIIPLTISIFAAEPKGGTIGFINASRFVGMALAPILSTSLVAYADLPTLYLSISGITLASYLGFRAFIK
jgi:MFS transporter, DHA1 family, multidrug resistance protein